MGQSIDKIDLPKQNFANMQKKAQKTYQMLPLKITQGSNIYFGGKWCWRHKWSSVHWEAMQRKKKFFPLSKYCSSNWLLPSWSLSAGILATAMESGAKKKEPKKRKKVSKAEGLGQWEGSWLGDLKVIQRFGEGEEKDGTFPPSQISRDSTCSRSSEQGERDKSKASTS